MGGNGSRSNYYPLTTGRKTNQYKNMLSKMFSGGAEAPIIDYPNYGGETQKQTFSKKLLSP
jgi:hypothetical protein